MWQGPVLPKCVNAHGNVDTHAFPLPPQARNEDHLVLVPLPASYASRVLADLEALRLGDRNTMFRPVVTGKHAHPYLWMKAREEAILHVAFLHGGGKTLTAARKVVADAIGATPNTLRDWGKHVHIHEGDLERARQAGNIEQQRLDLGRPHPSPMDAHVQSMIDRLSGKLPAFARDYRDKFGGRHWGGRVTAISGRSPSHL